MSIWVLLDVESDGPAPGIDMYSMISFGAVVLDNKLDQTFKGLVKPISDNWIPEALAVSSITRDQHLAYPDPKETMVAFDKWLEELGDNPILVSDNNGYDAAFMNYYLHKYVGRNLFGFSSRRIGDMYAGLTGMAMAGGRGWKRLRKTKHTHDPVDDAKGNAEALIELNKQYNFKIPGLK